MVCDPTDAMTLTAFLDLPYGPRFVRNLQAVERVMGLAQIRKRLESDQKQSIIRSL